MDGRLEADATPSEEWLQSLNATCNRLSTQYLTLLKAGSSIVALQQPTTNKEGTAGGSGHPQQHDPRAGGGRMGPTDPPLPPLAADVNMSTLQCKLAAENICVAASQLLSLIRTLRLSLLLMDQDTIQAEEEVEVERTQALTVQALTHAVELEQQYMELQSKLLNE